MAVDAGGHFPIRKSDAHPCLNPWSPEVRSFGVLSPLQCLSPLPFVFQATPSDFVSWHGTACWASLGPAPCASWKALAPWEHLALVPGVSSPVASKLFQAVILGPLGHPGSPLTCVAPLSFNFTAVFISLSGC